MTFDPQAAEFVADDCEKDWPIAAAMLRAAVERVRELEAQHRYEIIVRVAGMEKVVAAAKALLNDEDLDHYGERGYYAGYMSSAPFEALAAAVKELDR